MQHITINVHDSVTTAEIECFALATHLKRTGGVSLSVNELQSLGLDRLRELDAKGKALTTNAKPGNDFAAYDLNDPLGERVAAAKAANNSADDWAGYDMNVKVEG